jgi:hypothetical protein
MGKKSARAILIAAIVAAVLLLMWLGVSHYYRRLTTQRFDSTVLDECTSNQVKDAILSPQKHQELVDLLKHTHEIMVAFNVHYWLIGGSLLGAVRDGGMIPWDDDDDIGVLDSEWKSVRNNDDFLADLSARGLALISVIGSADKIVFIRDWQDILSSNKDIVRVSANEFMNRHAAFLDVFPFEIDPTNRKQMRLESWRDRIMFPNEWFEVENVFPRRLFAFSETKSDAILLYGPRNPFPYLTRNYGSRGKPTWIDSAVLASHSSISAMLRPCRLSATQVQKVKAQLIN